MADYRTYRLNIWEKISGGLLLALGVTVLGILFYDSALTVFLTPLFMKPAASVYASFMVGKQKDRLRRQFRDLLDSLAASFAGGRHMKEALEEALKELRAIYESDAEIVVELQQMIKRMEDGESDISVLENFAERADIEDVTMFVQVFRTCRETGGDLITAMSRASSMLGDKIKIENEIRALTSQKKTEGIVISITPVVIIVFLKSVAPEYVSVLYGNAAGAALMTAALAATCGAYLMIRKITDIEV